jgi:hypothetical protein
VAYGDPGFSHGLICNEGSCALYGGSSVQPSGLVLFVVQS